MNIKIDDEEYVSNIKALVKDNNGYCPYAPGKRSKIEKCPKWCGKQARCCECGMYIEVPDNYYDEEKVYE